VGGKEAILVLVILQGVNNTVKNDLVNFVGEHGDGGRSKEGAI
jgi:hypothetical protein